MNWYYVEAGQQAGPVDDAQLDELRRAGAIQPDTLIWREGMANWQAWREVKPASPGPAPLAPATELVPPVAGPAPPLAHGEAVCAECHGVFSIADMIPYGTIRVCANCKPIFMQKLAEGATLRTGALNYAGIGARFGAVLLDGILLYVVNTVLNLAAGLGLFREHVNPQAGPGAPLAVVLVFMLQMAITMSYEVVLVGRYGATLGKMACGIRVVTAEGQPVSYLRALGRYWAKQLSALTCMIGYLIAFWDKEKRALHDHICNTRVVNKPAPG